MKREEYRIAVTTKLKPAQADELKNTCDFGGVSQSAFIREAILEKLQSKHVSNIAGTNIIEFNSKIDAFKWKIKLDNGAERVILENLSTNFIEDLSNKLKTSLEDRNKLMHKTKETSISVPRRLMK